MDRIISRSELTRKDDRGEIITLTIERKSGMPPTVVITQTYMGQESRIEMTDREAAWMRYATIEFKRLDDMFSSDDKRKYEYEDDWS